MVFRNGSFSYLVPEYGYPMTILDKADLQFLNTFGIKVLAKHFTILRNLAEAQELLSSSLFKNEKHLFLGGGSNVLFTKDYDGLVAKIEWKEKKIVEETQDTVTLQVGAGESWHDLVLYCVRQNWGGIENLSLIPGTVGAAPMQNIGAYGVEIKNLISGVEAIELSGGKPVFFSNADCKFGYRESIFKNEVKDMYLISSVTLTLTKRNHLFHTSYGAIEEILAAEPDLALTVKRISDAVIQIRRSKLPDPSRIGNAGSFFKNPSIEADLRDLIHQRYPSLPSFPTEEGLYKIPAAWLIEQCGWKGKTFGNIGVHQHQALVIVNYGGGDGGKVWELAMKIQASVKDKFDIVLQPEVNVM